MDEWTELNPFAITHPKGWTIAKYSVSGNWKYMLWHGNDDKGVFDSASEAKSAFDRLTAE